MASRVDPGQVAVRKFCHRPSVVTDPTARLGDYLAMLEHQLVHRGDDVIDHDLILVWTPEERRVITGADILGRLLRGISRRADWQFSATAPGGRPPRRRRSWRRKRPA